MFARYLRQASELLRGQVASDDGHRHKVVPRLRLRHNVAPFPSQKGRVVRPAWCETVRDWGNIGGLVIEEQQFLAGVIVLRPVLLQSSSTLCRKDSMPSVAIRTLIRAFILFRRNQAVRLKTRNAASVTFRNSSTGTNS